MSKSKIEDRLNTMRHKQAQPTDSLTLAEPVKKMKQEQDEIPSLDELSGFKNLAEKQAVLAMYMNHESPDKIQKERERFEKKRAEKRGRLKPLSEERKLPDPMEYFNVRFAVAPKISDRDELMNVGKKLQNNPVPPAPEEPIVKKGPKTQDIVGMTRELKKNVSIFSYHGALYFFNTDYRFC